MKKLISSSPFAWQGLLSVILVLFFLGPLGLLLRTQNPWTCFPLTFDESFYLQAIVNWSQGNGFRLFDMAKEFEPTVSIGHPMAWAITALHWLTSWDWPQAGRFWVHLNFYAFLILLGVWTWKRSKNAWSVVLALGSIGYIVGEHPAGTYLIYGVLGEIPGALVGCISLLLLNTRRYLWAGVVAVLCFFIKPSFAFLIPAVVVAAFVFDRKKGLRVLASTAASGLLLLIFICVKREETPWQYAKVFLNGAMRVSQPTSFFSELQFFWGLGFGILLSIFAAVAVGFAGSRPLLKWKQWKWAREIYSVPLSPAELGAWILLAVGLIYYIVLRHAPQPKHWFVFYCLAGVFTCVRLSIWLGLKLSQWLDVRTAQTVFLAVVATWLLNVPGKSWREFKNGSILGCPVKEQRQLESQIQYLEEFGRLSAKNLAVVTDPATSAFLFSLGWNPKSVNSWKELGKPPHWVAGDIATLFPLHEDCKSFWKGRYAALAICKF
ncbi:hypothetical protein K2X30_03930 [bacterium]|nr:hypothetical protein [bacterium]